MSYLSDSKSAKLALSSLQQLGWKARNDANYALFFDVFCEYESETRLISVCCSSLLQVHDIKLTSSHLHKKSMVSSKRSPFYFNQQFQTTIQCSGKMNVLTVDMLSHCQFWMHLLTDAWKPPCKRKYEHSTILLRSANFHRFSRRLNECSLNKLFTIPNLRISILWRCFSPPLHLLPRVKSWSLPGETFDDRSTRTVLSHLSCIDGRSCGGWRWIHVRTLVYRRRLGGQDGDHDE